ncbi:hypothetical protein ACFOPP_14745 [Sphingobium sp. GCM10012300]
MFEVIASEGRDETFAEPCIECRILLPFRGEQGVDMIDVLNLAKYLHELDRIRRGGHVRSVSPQQMGRHPIADARVIQIAGGTDEHAAVGFHRLDAPHQIGIIGHLNDLH